MKNKGLSDKEFSEYYSGKMNDKEAHNFEARATDDDFISDATDGFLDHPEGIEALGGLKEKFYQKNNISTGLSGKSIMILSSAAIVLVVLSTIFLVKWNSSPEEQKLFTDQKKDQKEPIDQPKEDIAPLELDTASTPITEEARIIEEEKPIAPEKVIVEQKEITTYEEELTVDKLEKRNLLTLEINNEEKSIQKKKIAYLYLADFKVADYSNIYHNSNLPDEDLNGLPARFEKEKQIIENEPKLIKYQDYLEEALIKLKHENHTDCIQMLKKIEQTFPKDLNASFYQGIAYFNLKDYKHAGENFEKALSAPYFIFDEETEWYLYLCKKALGERAKAQKLLDQIKKRKGFYYKRAMKE